MADSAATCMSGRRKARPHPNVQFSEPCDLEVRDGEQYATDATSKAYKCCWQHSCNMVAEHGLNLKKDGRCVSFKQAELPCGMQAWA